MLTCVGGKLMPELVHQIKKVKSLTFILGMMLIVTPSVNIFVMSSE